MSRLKIRSSFRYIIFVLMILLPIAIWIGITQSQEQTTPAASGQGTPWANLWLKSSSGTGLISQDGSAGRSLAAADFNSDGIQDLATGMLSSEGGTVTIFPGNSKAIGPQSAAAIHEMISGKFEDPFYGGSSYLLNHVPDFLLAGDFNNDGFADIVSASRGGNKIHLLAGNGRGEFQSGLEVNLPGQITALSSLDVFEKDGVLDAVVAINGSTGPQLLVYQATRGGLKSEKPVEFSLPSPIAALAAADIDATGYSGLIAGAGNLIYAIRSANDSPAPIVELALPVMSIAAANFVFDREGLPEVAAVTSDGSIHILGRTSIDRRLFTDQEKQIIQKQRKSLTADGFASFIKSFVQSSKSDSWAVIHHIYGATIPSGLTGESLLVPANISGLTISDLLLINPTGSIQLLVNTEDGRKLDKLSGEQLFATEAVTRVTISGSSAPVAVLPMKLNVDAAQDFVLLPQGGNPEFLISAPLAVIDVQTTVDSLTDADGLCSLREAIINANNDDQSGSTNCPAGAGADVINVPAGTYTLLLTPFDDEFNLAGATETSGDLDILNDDLTINGAGAATTIIQAGPTPGSGIDRVIDVNNFAGPGTAVDLTVAGVTIRHGVGPETIDGYFTPGGGIMFDGFDIGVAGPSGVLTLSNSTITLNSAAGTGGGIMSIFGTVNSSGSTVSSNSTVHASGGGIHYDGSAFVTSGTLTVTNTVISSNSALDPTFGSGAGIRIGGGNGTTISGSSILNNNAGTDGGGINIDNAPATVINASSILNNNAQGNGGGIRSSAVNVISNTPSTLQLTGTDVMLNDADSEINGVGNGGGIYNFVGTITYNAARLEDNTAYNGAGLFNTQNSPTFPPASFTKVGGDLNDNFARNHGGGVYLETGTVVLDGAVLRGNDADSDTNGTGDGGGLYNVNGAASFLNSAVGGLAINDHDNRAVNGAGIAMVGAGSVLLDQFCDITGNAATGNGGGVYITNGTVTLNSTPLVQSNSAVNGGGIYRSGGSLNLNGPILFGGSTAQEANIATGNGGGISNVSGLLTLSGATLQGNQANSGGAVFNGGSLTITSTQILNNQATSTGGGILSSGTTNVSLSRFFGNSAPSGSGIAHTAGTVVAENNWWGCDGFPNTIGCPSTTGVVDFDPRVDLRFSASPAAIAPLDTSTLTADVNFNTDNVSIGPLSVLEGLTVTFDGGPLGSVAPLTAAIAAGQATTTFTAGATAGEALPTATLDNGTQATSVFIVDLNCSVAPLVDVNDINTNHTVTMTLLNGTNPVNGANVNFNISAGPNTGDAGVDTTDSNGDAAFTYLGDGGLGTDTIDASGNAVFNAIPFPFACSATKQWVDVEATLAPATDVNQINTQHTVTVTVTLNGTPAQNAPVTFDVIAGPNTGDTGGGTTDINGQASFTYTGDGGIGTDTIQASGGVDVGGILVPFNATASKQWTDVAATLTPAVDANQINTQHTVTATVTQDGAPVQGISVTFNITSGPNTGDNGNGTTDINGQASFTYTGDSGIGTDTIEASGTVVVSSVPIPFNTTATKEWVDVQIALSPLTDANPINTQHTVTATLTLNGTPQQSVDVNFAVSGVNNDTGTVATDVNGQAAFTYTGDNGVGTDTIQATGNVLVGAVPVPFSTSATKVWTDVQCALSPLTDTNAVGTPHTVTVTLTDGGSPLPGELVNFSVISGPNTGDGGSGTTNGSGQADFTYTGDGGIGTDTIQASGTVIINSVSFPFSCNATKDWVNVQATLTPAAATNPVNTQHTVTATVLLNGGPQQGVTVDFNIIAGPNTGDSGTVVTDVNGQASFTYTGDSGTGTDTIEATGVVIVGLESFPFSATATKQWVDLTTTLTPATDVNQINTNHTVTFTVSVNGAPVAGVDVDFDVTAGPNTGDNGTDTTDVNGEATFTYTGDGGIGTDTIQASGVVDIGGNDIPFNLTASKEWVNVQSVVTPAFDANPLNTDHTATATITLNGAPQQGITVNFNVTSGPNTGDNGTGTTDALGQTTFTWNGDSGIGTDLLQASGVVNVSGVDVPFTGTAQKRWVTVQSTLTPATDTNPVNTQHTATATVLLDGAPASGVAVNFNITAGPNSGDNGVVITDGNGQAAFTYTGDGGIGVDTIDASGNVDVGGVPIAFNSTATKEWVDVQCALAPLTDTNPTGTPHTVTVTVSNGPGPLTGVLVDFSITAGPNTGDTGSGTTDGAGQASFTYTGDGGFGTDTIQASGNAIINSVSFPFSCNASKQWVTAGATLTPLTAVNQINTSHTVTATITQDGSPASGVPVSFAVISGPNSGDNGIVITDANGNASFTYNGDSGIGVDTIQASGNLIVGGESIPFLATAQKQWVDVQASLAPPTDTNQINTPHTVTVTVTQDGAPVSGTSVTFNVTAGPNTGDTGNGVTDSNGQAAFTYTGDGGAGIDTITATGTVVIATNSIPFAATATKEWIDLQCALTPAAGTAQPGQNYTLTMLLSVGGNPQAGVPVTFDVLSGPNAGDTGNSITDANGQATFTYTGDGGSGTDTVQASGTFNSVPYSCTATVTWCLFCDEFEDSVLASNWQYQKGTWNETGGSLIGSNTKKALAIATPAFAGCSGCNVEATLQTSGGAFNRVWLLAWYQSKSQSVELLMKEESDKWVLKQRSGGVVVAKGNVSLPINPGVFYAARIVYDGTNFQLFIDGNLVLTVPAGAVPNGTVGFKSKGTTAFYGRIFVD